MLRSHSWCFCTNRDSDDEVSSNFQQLNTTMQTEFIYHYTPRFVHPCVLEASGSPAKNAMLKAGWITSKRGTTDRAWAASCRLMMEKIRTP